METAKVDFRKLQLLNDRINQTIDAMNQLRVSVHGLGAQMGVPTQTPFVPGLSHTGVIPQIPWIPGLSQMYPQTLAGIPQYNPYTAYGQSAQVSQIPWLNPLANIGLSHTGFDTADLSRLGTPYGALDPFTLARVTAAFPFALAPFCPTV